MKVYQTVKKESVKLKSAFISAVLAAATEMSECDYLNILGKLFFIGTCRGNVN